MSSSAADFLSRLSIVSGWCVYERQGTTWEFESDRVTLSFVIHERHFEIRNIDIRGNEGFGRRVTELVHEFADEHGLAVFASNVRGEARGFWQVMGYDEGNRSGEFFRYR